ncbi:MAG: hypothetical protein ACI35O_01700 [Bacillaceae bacterium]
MKKSMYWSIWGLVLVIINLSTIPISLFSLFGTAEGTSIFSIDYLIAFAILFIPNIVTISLFVSAKKENLTEFFIGVGLAIVEVIVMVSIFFDILESIMLCAVLIGLCGIGGIILIVKSIFLPSTKLAD